MAQHYHVGMNTPGYLPESDVYQYSNRRDAMQAAADEVRRLREDGFIVYGSARSGDYWTKGRSEHDLGLHVWISPCQDDCAEDDDSV